MKIKELATVQTGYSFRTRLENSQGGEISVIQMKDLREDNTVGCNNLARISMKAIKEHHLTQKGDLIFRTRGSQTTAAIISENPGKTIVAAPLLKIRITRPDKILPEYLNWYICQRDAQIFLTSQARGTVQKMISKQTIEELEIVLPNLEKQKSITELAALAAREYTLLHSLADKRKQYISAQLMQFATTDTKKETTNGHEETRIIT